MGQQQEESFGPRTAPPSSPRSPAPLRAAPPRAASFSPAQPRPPPQSSSPRVRQPVTRAPCSSAPHMLWELVLPTLPCIRGNQASGTPGSHGRLPRRPRALMRGTNLGGRYVARVSSRLSPIPRPRTVPVCRLAPRGAPAASPDSMGHGPVPSQANTTVVPHSAPRCTIRLRVLPTAWVSARPGPGLPRDEQGQGPRSTSWTDSMLVSKAGLGRFDPSVPCPLLQSSTPPGHLDSGCRKRPQD